MKLLSCYDVFSGCAWYRSTVPAYELAHQGHEVSVVRGGIPVLGLQQCDTLMVQRIWNVQGLGAIRYANSLGKLTVYDVDDDLWCIGPENSAWAFWQEHAGGAVEILRECAKVTTTNHRLAETLRQFHPDVTVIPNALPTDWAHSGETHDGLVIGWAGGSSHEADLRLIADMLYRVLDERPHVRLEICGAGEWMEHPRLTHLEPVAIEDYSKLLSRFDIGLAPLVDDRFNRAKSDLKVLEYAGLGIPAVASRVGPYADSIVHGDTGYLAVSPKDWRKYLLRLIDSEAERKARGGRAKEWADTRRIDRILPQWESVWSSPATTRRTGSPTPSSPHWLRPILAKSSS